MYIHFDYRCSPCDRIFTRMVKRTDMEKQHCQCGTEMTRLPPGTRTTFRFMDRKLKG